MREFLLVCTTFVIPPVIHLPQCQTARTLPNGSVRQHQISMLGDFFGAIQDSADPDDLSIDITYAEPVKFNMNHVSNSPRLPNS